MTKAESYTAIAIYIILTIIGVALLNVSIIFGGFLAVYSIVAGIISWRMYKEGF